MEEDNSVLSFQSAAMESVPWELEDDEDFVSDADEEERLEQEEDEDERDASPRLQGLSLSTLIAARVECLKKAALTYEALEEASKEYCTWCGRFYHAIILQTFQESIRKTLESIASAKRKYGKRKMNKRSRNSDVCGDELENILTAVQVYADRQDAIKTQLDACLEQFKAAREQYEKKKAELVALLLKERHVASETASRDRAVLNDRTEALNSEAGADEKRAWLEAELSRLDGAVRSQLLSLRKEYNANQPPPPVLVDW